MVFEAVVADVLNRFLGDYVENLNRSQLKIGIWGGDVVLENLVLKQNALDDLDLPVQTIFGHLGKLVLKIPWKNLYGASVEASIERLFLLVAPNQEVKYDADKEERLQLQSKQSELLRVEEAKKRTNDKEQQKVDDSFVEKLVTQIIKNVQLNIKDIHIRYEDKVTNPGAPFALGISLRNLSVNTTDETWRPCVLQEAVTKIFKVLDLEGLALYWNPDSILYTKYTREEMLHKFQMEIATKTDKPVHFKYVLGPINASAKLKLNPKPEQDVPKFEIPKCVLSLDMDQLAIGITKGQYQDIMKLADSMDRMTKGMPYRKYRPFLTMYRGHYKEWWKFAYDCVLEQEVRRRRRNWQWEHICEHRDTCRRYASAYQTKLQTPAAKLHQDLKHLLEDCERKLDLFNLVVIRQRIEMEVERLGKAQEEANKNKGWFSSWWGGGAAKNEELSESTDIMKQFEKAMTADEKAKLFQAIDYQENSAPTHLPVEFVATECHFTLGCLVLHVTDDHVDVLTSRLNHVQASLSQRPSANGLKVIVRMQEFTVAGLKQKEMTPHLVTSKQITPGLSLLDVVFETNPIDGKCSQRIKVAAQPLQMVYDAQTIIKVVDVFKLPSESSALTQLQAAAGNKLSNLKEKSALGLQHAVRQHAIVDIDINFCSSYLILPHSGIFTKNESCVVVNLGAVSIKSAPRSDNAFDVHKLFKEGADDEEILKQAIKHSYDKFILMLTDMQVVIANKSEDWAPSILQSTSTPLHLLQPTTLKIEIDKCLITDDPRLPKIKVYGHLPKIAINASEDRLITLLEVLVSVPFPKDEQATPLKPSESRSSSLSLLKYFDPAENKKRQAEKKPRPQELDDFIQLTEVEACFMMDELLLMVMRRASSSALPSPLASFELHGLEMRAVQRTLTLEAAVQLGSVAVSLHRQLQGHPLQMVQTPRGDIDKQYLFTIRYCNVDKKCPDFHSRHKSVEQLIELDFTVLQLLLHQEGIQELLTVASQFQARLAIVQGEKDRAGSAGTPLSTIPEDEEMPTAKASRITSAMSSRKKRAQVETIGLKVQMSMQQVGVELATEKRSLAKMAVVGLNAGLIMKNSYMQVNATLQDIKVIDQNPETIHTQILSIVGGDALTAEIVIYNMEHYTNVDSNDMTIDAQVSCIRIVFLNWFVSSMLSFLNNFQAAQQAIKDASAMAAESAKANVQNAYEKATKVAMNIRLKAPIVIAPENSKSYYAVMVDFGYITITNTFLEMDVKSEHNVVVDELTLVLDELKLSRVKLTMDADAISNEKMLLQPTSFNLIVKRNLASSWYSKIPDIDMSGRLKAIKVKIANEDFKMVMKVLSENLTEGSNELAPVPVGHEVPQLKTSLSVDSRSSMVLKKSDTAVYAAKRKESDVVAPPKTVMKFTFTMDSLTIEMMNKISDNPNIGTPSSLGATDEVGLARFSLRLLSVKGKMHSNSCMYTSLLLVDCLLDDTRPHRQGRITRFMERRGGAGAEELSVDKCRSMIDITFTQKQDDIFMDVRVFSFNLILSMDFMMKIADFVTSGLATMSADTPKPAEAVEAPEVTASKPTDSAISRKVSRISVPESNQKKDVPKPTVVEPAKQSGVITINLRVEKPDIILVESMDDMECQALVLNNEVTFKMRMTALEKDMSGCIQQLQLFTCRYGRTGILGGVMARHAVLVPCDVILDAKANDTGGWSVALEFSDIRINVSPATIDLLNRVLVTMTRSEDDTGPKPDTVSIYKDLWEIKPFQDYQYWFLRTELAQDALETYSIPNQDLEQAKVPLGEVCRMNAPVIVLNIEAGLGSDTIPMLSMHASLVAEVKDWSGQLNMESTWAMQISYYNNSLALWEPLVEPVEVYENNQYKHVPWELKMQVQMNKSSTNQEANVSSSNLVEASPGTSADTTDGDVNLPQPNLAVSITSSETLELTITNTVLQVLTQLGKSFSTAVKGGLQSETTESSSPYLVKNDTGLSVAVMVGGADDNFTVYKHAIGGPVNEVIVEHGGSLPLELKDGMITSTGLNQTLPQWSLKIKILELECELVLPVVRADKRYFPLQKSPGLRRESPPKQAAADGCGLISEVVMVEGTIHINLRSVLQVINQLSVPVQVHYVTGSDVESAGWVSPGAVMNLPLRAAHTPTGELLLSLDGYGLSSSLSTWRQLQQSIQHTTLLACASTTHPQKDKFFIKAVGEMEQVFYTVTSRRTFSSACFNICLRPAVVLQNCLPVDVLVSPQGVQNPEEHLVKPGATLHLPQVEPGTTQLVVMLPVYLEKCWVCTARLLAQAPEFDVWTFESNDSSVQMILDLGMHCKEVNGSQHFSLYCPFWMLNKTGLPLAYRASEESNNVLYHPSEFKEPILFSFRAKNFFGKKKASIRVENGEWSDKFSLDVPGSSGVIMCKNNGRVYQIGVSNTLTYNSLSKMVTFTPYFLLMNKCPFSVSWQEVDRPGDAFTSVDSLCSKAMWPLSEKDDKLMRLKVTEHPAISAPFIYTDQHTSLLKLNNQYGGIYVESQVTEGGVYITLGQYRPGLAPALIINHSPFNINIWEKESINIRALKGKHCMMYTWENPAGPRIIVCEGIKKKEVENDLRKDGIGELMVGHDTRVYWVSFLDGMQRVLLFTPHIMLAHGAHTAGEAGAISTEVSLSMHGLGLSLVNNLQRQEILYISIASSGIIWEQSKLGSKRFKALSLEDTAKVEGCYQSFLQEAELAQKTVSGRVIIDTKTEVDFESMVMLRPNKRSLRRTLQPGIWAAWGSGTHRTQLHARLHRLQADQQLPAPTFPTLLAPVPPPKSVVTESQAMKPFVELCIVERIMEHTNVKQYKYFKILIQEFHVKVDMGLINALMAMFPTQEISEQEAAERFALDVEASARPLESVVEAGAASDLKHFYDQLHLSPLKVHVSFSMGGDAQLPSFLGTLLQGLGVTLTDMNDVIFKLAYYERNYEFLSQKELVSTVSSHYTGQAIKQLYVLVLGLDVIGNPYGLVIGLSKGVEDLFYEPFQGAIQGPGEFAEGLFLGVRSLVGHAVGGVAGAVSRISGAMGHGLAALSCDSDFQRKRRDNINKPPANLQEGIARSGKGLFMGVVDGVTGVFTKPLSGAREDGARGFFKGLGKGAVGLVARPTAGVVDFASGSLDAVKRATDLSSEVARLRPPRWLEGDGLVRPYSKLSAEGAKLLRDLEKGKYIGTDMYIMHLWVISQKELVLCTDKRIAYVDKNTVFGGWQLLWSYTWVELTRCVPQSVDRGVFVPNPEGKKRGMFGSSTTGHLILLHREADRSSLVKTCERLIQETH